MIHCRADNRPRHIGEIYCILLEDRMEHKKHCIKGKNGRIVLNSVQNGPLVWPTIVQEDGTTRTKKYEELSVTEPLIQGMYRFCGNQVQGRQGQSYAGTSNKAKRPRNAAWFKDKAMLAEAQESGQILDEEQLAFLVDPGILDGQAAQKTILNNAAFQTEDLDAYDSDCDDVSNAKAVLMANLSNYGSDVISEVPHSESYHNAMDNQSVHEMQDFEQTPVVYFPDNEITSDSDAVVVRLLYEVLQLPMQSETYHNDMDNQSVHAMQDFEQTPVIDFYNNEIHSDTNLYAQQDSMILSVIEQMSEQMINHVNNWEKANQEKNNELVNAKLDRYKEKVKTFEQRLNIDLTLGYQNLFYLKKAQQIKPTLYDGSVISSQHVVMHVVDDEETLILEEVEALSELPMLQAKDTTICKLKEHIKSIRENDKEEKVKHDISELETINEELKNSVTKLLSKNERLCKEINHVKQVFKDQFDSIKKTRVCTKEQSDSLISKLNLKSVINEDLKAQIQDMVFVITSLKNDLRKFRGKEIVENAAQIPIATTIAPGMFKLDI
ncbi:hypothetical protein Tco_1403801 [Tanacetum coccineum]